ncbi:HTH-type transcriptional regulator AbgR [Delftia tsuruhatensis]|uniref:LysR family transcriptional regulator n=1 Tax=Delftia tsuruhatensis TaxID=180282 RepID=UPI001E6ED5A3|nr:LysR substrate-binding domain-containing protein [Delftia tsuruhatensis]CAB5721146.1 HTH-type transcriptional regulator AbgR [Delftia tsuruhatensis]CAC9688016.1 HTH-type transcriptional regulator AbgR [Delftia tsuruhatensis]
MFESSRMKTYQMRALVACAQHRSMRAAADELALSHSALNKAIRELEQELGVPLVVRSARGIGLTQYGEVVSARARKILEDMRRLHDEIEQIRGGPHGRITVAVTSTMAFCVLPLAYARFRRRLPQVEVEILELSTEQVGTQLAEGRIDFAITHFELTQLPAGCEFAPQCTGTLVAIVRAGHPARKARRLAQLLDFEWVYPSQLVMRREFEDIFSGLGLTAPQRVICSQSATFNTRLVAESDAIALLSRPFAAHPWNKSRLLALALEDPLPRIAPGTVVLQGTHLPPATEQLRAEVHQVIAELDWT